MSNVVEHRKTTKHLEAASKLKKLHLPAKRAIKVPGPSKITPPLDKTQKTMNLTLPDDFQTFDFYGM